MPQIDTQLQHSALGLIGSFWSSQVDAGTRLKARAVATLMANASGLRRLGELVAQLVSDQRTTVEDVMVPFVDGDIAFVGPDLFDYIRSTLGLGPNDYIRLARPDSREMQYLGNAVRLGRFTASPGDASDFPGVESLHLVPVPYDLTPIVIATRDPDRYLTVGVDFTSHQGFISMKESPSRLFQPGGMRVVIGTRELDAPYGYTARIDGKPYGNRFVTAYQRRGQSVAAFEKAAAEAAGLFVLPVDDTVIFAEETTLGSRYTFANVGVVDIPYPHNRLERGVTYPAGKIVGDGFRITSGAGKTVDWLHNATGGGVYSLDGVLPVKGLLLPSAPVTVDWVELSDDNIPHARVHLPEGPDGDVSEFWAMQKAHELRTGNFLANDIDLTADIPSMQIDFVSLLASYYGSRLILVDYGMPLADPGYRDRLLKFIHENKPVGSVLITSV